MNYYFIAALILYVMNLGINLTRNGEPREDKYSFFYITYIMLDCFGINVFSNTNRVLGGIYERSKI